MSEAPWGGLGRQTGGIHSTSTLAVNHCQFNLWRLSFLTCEMGVMVPVKQAAVGKGSAWGPAQRPA